jgi:very-short-patch-repair endonuclease
MRDSAELSHRAIGQNGVFTRADLRALGVSAKRERNRVAAGLWVPVLGATYVTATTAIGPWQRATAASLISGGVVSHQSAAQLHEIPVVATQLVHVWVPDNRHIKVPGLRAHHGQLLDTDVERAIGVPVTTRTRTLVDCLAVLPFDAALTLAREAVFRKWLRVVELQDAISLRRGQNGTPQLSRIVARLVAGGASEAELKLHELLRRGRFDGWVANQIVYDARGRIGEVDVLFPGLRLVIEVDGFAVHGGDLGVFQRDRTKQNRLSNAGYVVLRFTWHDLVERPDEVIATIRRALLRVSA